MFHNIVQEFNFSYNFDVLEAFRNKQYYNPKKLCLCLNNVTVMNKNNKTKRKPAFRLVFRFKSLFLQHLLPLVSYITYTLRSVFSTVSALDLIYS